MAILEKRVNFGRLRHLSLEFRIAGITAERGSFLQIQKQMYTKIGNGTLSPSNITASTYGKMSVATGVQQAPGATVQGVLNNLKSILNQISSVLSGMSSSNSSKQK